MRALGAAVLALGCLAAPAVGSGSNDPGAVEDPSCKLTLEQAPESHGARYSTRCNFQQTQIVVKSTSRIYDVDVDPPLKGPLDPGDGFSCRVPVVSRKATCKGSAGAGVGVGGYLETKAFHCEVASKFTIIGGPDCAPDEVCIELAYVINKDSRRPSTCGPGS